MDFKQPTMTSQPARVCQEVCRLGADLIWSTGVEDVAIQLRPISPAARWPTARPALQML